MKYKKSEYLKMVSHNTKTMVYHSLFNRPMIFKENAVRLLNIFRNPISFDQLEGIVGGDVTDLLDIFVKNYYIVDEVTDERELLKEKQEHFIKQIERGERLSRLELVISNQCNLTCPHCLHYKNNHTCRRRSGDENMSIDTAKKSIDIFVNKIKEVGNNKVRIHFGNGEPLINWETIVYCLDYTSRIPDVEFTYAMNSNLTLLTLEQAIVLKKYKVDIGTSLDGLKEDHDKIRKDMQGEGTFDTVLSKMLMLREIDFPLSTFSITATEKNFKNIGTDMLDFAKDLGLKGVSMDFDLVDTNDISPEESVALILKMRRYAFDNDLDFNGTWETPYRHLMFFSWLDGPYAFCPAMEGNTLEFGVDGTLKVCGHTNTVVGNALTVDELFREDSDYFNLIRNRQAGNNDFCGYCRIEGCCTGQCHVTLESARRNSDLMDRMCKYMRLMTVSLIKDHLEYDA